ncbi:MAG: hypothetical protein ABEJ85_05395 [Haloarculaceae archaeon]
MPSTTRRSVLASLGAVAVGSIAGCNAVGSADPPAGSLRFVNDHDLPHAIRMEVTDVGDAPGDGPAAVTGDPIVPPAQRTLTASTVVDPGETQTYESVFTEPVWYAVQFTVDGREPENDAGITAFHPAPADGESGSTLTGKVYSSGEFSWVVGSTENPGPFEG